MPANGNLSNSERTCFPNDSSWSSNSETFGDVEVRKSPNLITKQWNAIERTLYDEEGEQIEDPELFKECVIWKQTFPHLRVRGKKIDACEGVEERIVPKIVQPSQNQINFNQLYEKRETIKNRVVGEIVQRLITRFNGTKLPDFSRIHPENQTRKKGPEIIEIDESSYSSMPSQLPRKNAIKKPSLSDKRKENREISLPSSQRESYFERGKKVQEDDDVSIEKLEKRIYEIFDSWEEEKEDERDKKNQTIKSEIMKPVRGPVGLNKTYDLKVPNGEKIGLNNSVKSSRGRTKNTFTGDSPSSYIKPFEITNKIDRKYEGLLNKIMERNCGVTTDPKKQNCQNLRNTARQQETESRTCFASLEKIRIKSGFNEFYKSNHNLPKISTIKTQNSWLERSEKFVAASSTAPYDVPHLRKSKHVSSEGINPHGRLIKPEKGYVQTETEDEMDEKFLMELKKEMYSHWKRPPMRNGGVLEEINLRRPKPILTKNQTKRNLKSSSSEDLPNKNKKNLRQPKKCSGDSNRDGNPKTRTKFTAAKEIYGRKGNSSGTLPPIETGIICTELVGRPKVGSKTLPKKR